ncbi:MAG: hypothetical protein E7191_01765 [Erysipelotrichaceae bacterium]|nr:hypothetical protein [Erysipelotrichaceae bacterium]
MTDSFTFHEQSLNKYTLHATTSTLPNERAIRAKGSVLKRVKDTLHNGLRQFISDIYACEKIYIGGIALYEHDDVVPRDGYTVYYVNGRDGEDGYSTEIEPKRWSTKLEYNAQKKLYTMTLHGLEVKREPTSDMERSERMCIYFESNQASLEIVIQGDNYLLVESDEYTPCVSLECRGEGREVFISGDGKLIAHSSNGIAFRVEADTIMRGATIMVHADLGVYIDDESGAKFTMIGGRLIALGRKAAILGNFDLGVTSWYQWRTIEDGIMIDSDELKCVVNKEKYVRIEEKR